MNKITNFELDTLLPVIKAALAAKVREDESGVWFAKRRIESPTDWWNVLEDIARAAAVAARSEFLLTKAGEPQSEGAGYFSGRTQGEGPRPGFHVLTSTRGWNEDGEEYSSHQGKSFELSPHGLISALCWAQRQERDNPNLLSVEVRVSWAGALPEGSEEWLKPFNPKLMYKEKE